ncbi:MAG: glycosyltransferase, partial [Selenomonas sp.]
MRISACWITRNEAKNISSSIASVAASVDEIVVYDTGSEDDTCRIVEKIPKAKLFRGSWHDDFAAARNEALSHATGDWVVFLDADERFSEETRGNLRVILEEAKEYDALAVKIVNLDIDGERERRIDHTYVVRA